MSVLKVLSVSALAALGTVSVPSGAAPKASVPAARTSSLVQAKTIRVQEQFQLFDSKLGQFKPFFNNTVLISRPGKIKVIAAQTQPGRKPHLYVADGKTEREYNALNNTYQTVAPRPDGSSLSQLRDMSCVDLILNGGPKPPAAKVRRVVSTETLDGRAMLVTTDTEPSRTDTDGNTYRFSTKIWMDAKTKLPYRWEFLSASNGKTAPHQRLNFSGWVLNKPIPPAQIAWAPPTGSKLYTEPALLPVGTPAPDFAALTPDGKTVHLSDYKGKAVILDFWATWCGPCQHSMPHLEKVYQQIKDKNVTVLAVCVWDKKDAYSKWVTANIGTKYTFPVAFDPAGQSNPQNIAGGLYHVSGIPTQYLIDKNGNIAAATVGYTKDDHELEKALSSLGVIVPVVGGS